MYAFSLAVVLLGLFHNIVALEVPSEFNCKNSLISDEWRREVLKFHNDYRRRVAEGKQATKGGTMPAAKDMNELTWDCNIEYQALQQSCDNNPQLPTNTANPPLPYSRLVADFKMNSNCNKSSVTTDKLKEWWNEVKTVDLTQTVEYTADIKNFGQMVNSKVTGFACTYNKCDSGGKLVCMYDSSRDDTTNKVLYDKGGTCTCQDCVKFLCQPDYKVSTVTEPQPLAIDGMTYDQEMLALRLTNYYRRLLATGWAEDSKGYAKWAAKMPPLAYEAPIAVHAKSEADDCDKTTYTPDAANSLNFFKGSYQDTIEKTIEEAIKSWWGKLKGVDVPDNGDYTGDMETNAQFFANMAYEGATKMGCAVADCKQKGFTAFICEYNSAPVVDDTLYTVGKTCSKCTTKKCEDAGGLCAP